MFKSLICFSSFAFLLVFSFGCIRLPIGQTKINKHKNTIYKHPEPNFLASEDFSSDKAWINKKTGSIISYKSTCPSSVSNLKEPLQGLSSAFSNVEVLKSEVVSYSNRKAYRYSFSGEVEGIANVFDLLAFKKYGCFFIVSHSGLSKNINKTEKSFEEFILNFKVKK